MTILNREFTVNTIKKQCSFTEKIAKPLYTTWSLIFIP